jgi:hypothetical protein
MMAKSTKRKTGKARKKATIKGSKRLHQHAKQQKNFKLVTLQAFVLKLRVFKVPMGEFQEGHLVKY